MVRILKWLAAGVVALLIIGGFIWLATLPAPKVQPVAVSSTVFTVSDTPSTVTDPFSTT